jgi:spermidine synthase
MGSEYAEVARAESPRGEVVLRRRQRDSAASVLELRVNGVFVMDTAETSTEEALAAAALDLVAEPKQVLVGGLGLGFTAQRVLADPRVESVAVVEIEEPVVAWMRDGTIPHGPAILADERLTVVEADLAIALEEAEETGPAYDLVLLDVDNGPGYLVHDHNRALYEEPFLARVRGVLRPGGAVVVWSAAPAPELQAIMEATYGDCTEVAIDVTLQEREEQYLLYLSRHTGA